MGKMVEFRYYFDTSDKNVPQGDWLNNLSSSIFYNYTRSDKEIYEADGTTTIDHGKYIIDQIKFTTFPGVQLTLYMGVQSAVYTPTITIGYSGIYELNLKEMNKNILYHNKKMKIFGFEIKDTDKEILNLTKNHFIIVTIMYSLAQEEEEEV